MLDKTDGAIDWAQPARAIAARIRGVDPWPGAYATLRGKPIKLFRADVTARTAEGAAGTVVAIARDGDHDASIGGDVARANLDDRDRRLASELVYGVLRLRARLERLIGAHADLKKTPLRVVIALRVAAYQLRFLDRVPAYAVVDEAVGAARASGGAKLAGFANAVLRKVGSAPEPT